MISIEDDVRNSINILDSEDMSDKVYSSMIHMLDLIPDKKDSHLIQWLGYEEKKKTFDFLHALKDGIYIPHNRSYFSGTFDIKNDKFPDKCSLYLEPNKRANFRYAIVKRENRLPKGYLYTGGSFAAAYSVTVTEFFKEKYYGEYIHSSKSFFVVSKTGKIGAAISVNDFRELAPNKFTAYHCCEIGAAALSLDADRRYLWNVRGEMILDDVITLKVDFGVKEDYIKSLLIARDGYKNTPTGRRNPILHWVNAHKRMIEKKENIDIKKHLRGANKFVMDDIEFQITNPLKEER